MGAGVSVFIMITCAVILVLFNKNEYSETTYNVYDIRAPNTNGSLSGDITTDKNAF